MKPECYYWEYIPHEAVGKYLYHNLFVSFYPFIESCFQSFLRNIIRFLVYRYLSVYELPLSYLDHVLLEEFLFVHVFIVCNL